MSFAEKFREKADEYRLLGEAAESLVMRAWYESLHRSYVLLAADEDWHYSQPLLPMIESGSMQPSARDMETLDELEAELAFHVAARTRGDNVAA